MRADAQRNYQRVVDCARAAFEKYGTGASLEDIAAEAGVGSATLHRHFRSRHALIAAVFADRVEALCARADHCAKAAKPERALLDWLRALADHVSAYRGLAAALLDAEEDLSSCRDAIRAAGAALLARAQETGAVRADVTATELLTLTTAVAIAAEQAGTAPAATGRLLALMMEGMSGNR
jgi:AcrR family transcriptional regulator